MSVNKTGSFPDAKYKVFVFLLTSPLDKNVVFLSVAYRRNAEMMVSPFHISGFFPPFHVLY